MNNKTKRKQGFTQHHFFAKKKKSGAGFTLIELLIVIVIIGIISSIVIIVVGDATAKGRDVRRLADVRQLASILERENILNPGAVLGGCDTANASTTACNSPAAIARYFPDIKDPANPAAHIICAPGVTEICNYGISNELGTGGATTDDYRITFYLERGVQGFPAGLQTVTTGIFFARTGVGNGAPGPTTYFLFDTLATTTGRIEVSGFAVGRASADEMCRIDAHRPAACQQPATTENTWAFISVSATDEIRDMLPGGEGGSWVEDENAPWYFKNGDHPGVRAADNWTDLLDGSVDNRPVDGGLDGGGTYWTGSTWDGALNPRSCSGWTSSAADQSGERGHFTQTCHRWLDWAGGTCSFAYSVLCACF